MSDNIELTDEQFQSILLQKHKKVAERRRNLVKLLKRRRVHDAQELAWAIESAYIDDIIAAVEQIDSTDLAYALQNLARRFRYVE